MKKLTMTIIFMFTLITPSFADFTLADLFVSGGTQTQDNNKSKDIYVHDCW